MRAVLRCAATWVTAAGQGGATRRLVIAAAVSAAAIGLSLVAPGVALASTVTVTNCNSSGAGSLPGAVASAAAGDTITFDPTLSCPPASPITLTSTLDIAENLTISGPGAAAMAVSGGGSVQVVDITSGTVSISGLTIENGNSRFPGGGGIANAGTVTLTGSTVSGNTTSSGGGGGIANDSGGTVTVTGSTVSGNTAVGGGGISNDGGTVTLTDSTVSGNTTTEFMGSPSNGGGIANGAGTLTLTASTISGNSATGVGGGILYNATVNAGGTIVAGNTAGSGNPNCDGSGLTSAGYNLTDDTSGADCGFTQPTDVVGQDPLLGPLGNNGGPTLTMMPGSGSPAVGAIPSDTTVTIGSNKVQLCPATDQRGLATAAAANCDIGAVQTTGSAPALALTDSAAPVTFNAAGQVITYSYKVTNTGAGPLTGISVTDPAVPGVSCPSPVLAAGTSEVCTGSYTTTAGDLAAGTITDTATANGASGWLPVTSNTAMVTVAKGWPPAVSGTFRPAAGAAEGYYVGATNNTWQLLVTHPGTAKVAFTGRISVPAGTLGHLTLINPGRGHQVSSTGKVITFTLPNYGKVTGFSFTTAAKVTSITLTLNTGGHPATTSQLFLGNPPANPGSGSPLTFTR